MIAKDDGMAHVIAATVTDFLGQIREEAKKTHLPMYRIKFKHPVSLVRNRFGRKEFTEVVLKFFISTGGAFAYTFHKRHGFEVHKDFSNVDIESIERLKKMPIDWVNKARIMKNKIHPNLWPELRKLTAEEFKNSFMDSSFNPVYFIKKFPRWQQKPIAEAVKKAIETKTNYTTTYRTHHHSGRDLSIEISVGKDGELRAWFSSEYQGCANGDYYIILNENVAMYCERD